MDRVASMSISREEHTYDLRLVEELIKAIKNSSYMSQLNSLERLATLIEEEESCFREVSGDPWAIPNQRLGFNIGKILATVKEHEQVYDRIVEGWVLGQGSSIEQQASGLRFLLSVLTCGQFKYPLTEESFMENIQRWAAEYGDSTPLVLDPAPADEAAFTLEERSVYATGLLATSLSNLDYVENQVMGPLLSKVSKYLRLAVLEPLRNPTASLSSNYNCPNMHVEAANQSASILADLNGEACEDEKGTFSCPAPPKESVLVTPVLITSLAVRARQLRQRRVRYCIQIISQTGEFVESLAPVLQEQGVDLLITLLSHCHTPTPASLELLGEPRPWLTHEVLDMLSALLTHRRFAELFVELGGVQHLLKLPKNVHTFSGMSLAFFGISTMPLAFERVCSSTDTTQLVATALPLIGCGFDMARKSAAMFFATSINYRAMLREFDAQDGLRRMLNMLRALVSQLRSSQLPDLRMERQVGFHCCLAVQQWLRAHLHLQVQAVRRGLVQGVGTDSSRMDPSASHKPIDVSQEAVDSALYALEYDRRLAEAFARTRWTALEILVDQGGLQLMMELVQYSPQERWFHEISLSALHILQLVTLTPSTRRLVVGGMLPNQRPGMAVLLWAATPPTSAFLNNDPEIIAASLQVIANCVNAPASLLPAINNAISARTTVAPRGNGVLNFPTAALHTSPMQQTSGSSRVAPRGSSPSRLGAGRNVDVGAGVFPPNVNTSSWPSDPQDPNQQGQTALPELDLGPASVMTANAASSSLGQTLETIYAYTRQCIRSNNGLRIIIQLLQPGGHMGSSGFRNSRGGHMGAGSGSTAGLGGSALGGGGAPSSMGLQGGMMAGEAALIAERIRALAAKCLLGLARDSSIRHILGKLQISRQLAEMVRDPLYNNSSNTPSMARLQRSFASPQPSTSTSTSYAAVLAPPPHQPRSWNEIFNRSALELIALTATTTAAGRTDRVSAAATDTAGGALHKIERAAIAAATPVSYSPQELLLLIHEHLRASGLHTAAAALHKEAALSRVTSSMASVTTLAQTPMSLSYATQEAAALDRPPPSFIDSSLVNHTDWAVISTPAGGGVKPATAAMSAARRKLGISPALQSLASQSAAQQQVNAASAAAAITTPAGDIRVVPGTATATASVLKHDAVLPQVRSHHMPVQDCSVSTRTSPAVASQSCEQGLGFSEQGLNLTLTPHIYRPAPQGEETATLRLKPVHTSTHSTMPHVSSTPHPRSSYIASNIASGEKRRAEEQLQPISASRSGKERLSEGVAQEEGTAAMPKMPNFPTSTPGFTTPLAMQQGRQTSPSHCSEAAAVGLRPCAIFSQDQQDVEMGHAPVQNMEKVVPEQQLPGVCRTNSNSTQQPPALFNTPALPVSSKPVNPLLLDLPLRRPQPPVGAIMARRLSGSGDVEHTHTAQAPMTASSPAMLCPPETLNVNGQPIVMAEPLQLPRHLEAACREVRTLAGPPANSKLHSIVMSYLKHQHRQACMQSAAPTSTLPPIQLSKPYALPQAMHVLDAPVHVTQRLSRRDVFGANGGRGGTKAQRQFVYSRFRQVQSIRDDSSIATCVAFVGGADIVAAGSHSGEIRMIDASAGDVMDVIDAHSAAVVSLRTHDLEDTTLLLSSSKHEIKLWDGMGMSRGPVVTWEQATRGRFNHAGTQVAAVSCSGMPRQAYIYDVTTHTKVSTLQDSILMGGPSPSRSERSGRAVLSAAWSPADDLLLWGCTLWDLRVPKAIHHFDQFTELSSGCFHPRGLEVILNSEVWDLHTFKLLRSVPCLDSTSITFNGTGDVMYTVARRPGDGDLSLGYLHQRTRARHPLHTAFRTLDALSYAEIATIDVERSVLDLAVEPTNMMVCLATLDVADAAAMSSTVRLFEVGRQKSGHGDSDSDDDDDGEDGAEEDEESDDDDGFDSDLLLDSGSEDGTLEGDTPATNRGGRRRGGGAPGHRVLREADRGTHRRTPSMQTGDQVDVEGGANTSQEAAQQQGVEDMDGDGDSLSFDSGEGEEGESDGSSEGALDDEDEEALLLDGEDPFDPELAFALVQELDDDEEELEEEDSELDDEDDDDDDMEENFSSEDVDEDPGQRVREIAAMRRHHRRRR